MDSSRRSSCIATRGKRTIHSAISHYTTTWGHHLLSIMNTHNPQKPQHSNSHIPYSQQRKQHPTSVPCACNGEFVKKKKKNKAEMNILERKKKEKKTLTHETTTRKVTNMRKVCLAQTVISGHAPAQPGGH